MDTVTAKEGIVGVLFKACPLRGNKDIQVEFTTDSVSVFYRTNGESIDFSIYSDSEMDDFVRVYPARGEQKQIQVKERWEPCGWVDLLLAGTIPLRFPNFVRNGNQAYYLFPN